jgi:hypothetical protein
MLALWALQRRMVLRPDMFSMIAFGVELLALDAFARGKTRALALVPLAHLCGPTAISCGRCRW